MNARCDIIDFVDLFNTECPMDCLCRDCRYYIQCNFAEAYTIVYNTPINKTNSMMLYSEGENV